MVGIVGLVLMAPLAVTSTNRMIKRLGPKRWKMLHRLVYVVAIAAALHFAMLVKADLTRPIAFAIPIAMLFAWRLGAYYYQLRSDSYQFRNSPATSPVPISTVSPSDMSPARADSLASVTEEPVGAPATTPDPSEPDSTSVDGTAMITFARSGKSMPMSAAKTVLEAADDLGVSINYDCRSGICGQCKTKLLAGRVIMETQDALEPVDRANNVILSCQARCVGQVVVDA